MIGKYLEFQKKGYWKWKIKKILIRFGFIKYGSKKIIMFVENVVTRKYLMFHGLFLIFMNLQTMFPAVNVIPFTQEST